MMTGMMNAMRLQAQRAMSGLESSRVGLITSYEPATFAVKVMLQPEGIPSGWLPLCSPWIGNGWGMFCAPSIGDMVAVHFFGGDLEAGFVEGRLFNDADRALPVPSGEFWLQHVTGSFLKFTSDGSVSVNAAANLTATVAGNLVATIAGNLTASAAAVAITAPTTTINGAVTINGATTLNGPLSQLANAPGGTAATLIGPLAVTNAVTAMGISLNLHIHRGVQSGGQVSGFPA